MGRDRAGDSRRAVTAFFDEPGAAQQAVDDLAAAGVDPARITLLDGQEEAGGTEARPTRQKGVWDILKGLFMAEEDRHAYGEGLRRGGCLLSVIAQGDDAKIVEIMDREGAVDMDARESDWQLEGWDPVRAAADLDALGTGGSDPAARSLLSAGPAGSAPLAAVGPGEARDAPPRAVRDLEAEGLRLRTYVESRDHPDPLR